jgi:hypothetical protein
MQVSIQAVPGGWQIIYWEAEQGGGSVRRAEYCTAWESVEKTLRFLYGIK